MENLILRQLSEPEVRKMLREEIQGAVKKCFSEQHEMSKPQLMNVEQVSEYLSVSVASIYSKVHRRDIPYIKRGKRLMFGVEDINDWLTKGRIKTQTEIKQEAEQLLSDNQL